MCLRTLWLITACAASVSAAEQFSSDRWGLSMRAPVANAKVPDASEMIAVFFLPGSNGFSPNVNVQYQRFVGDLTTYDALSKSQFDRHHLHLISITVVGAWHAYEYAGALHGSQALHFYAKVAKMREGVVLITATAREDQWAGAKDALMASVNSVTLRP